MTASRQRRREALACCPACAASLPRPRRRTSRPAWTWVPLLGVTAALVPLAAMDGGEPAVAYAAAAAPAPPPVEAEPAGPSGPPEQPRPTRRPERSPVPSVEWRDSRALGTANAGRLERGVRLPAQGPGHYTYDPLTQRAPASGERTWGTAALVREVLDLGEWWARTHPDRAPLGIGDLSREGGGSVVGHASHENGLDVDIRLVRRDDARAPVSQYTYDREATQAVVDRLVSRGAQLVLIGPNLDLHGPAGVVMRWPNHDDHLHVRFPDPDGAGN